MPDLSLLATPRLAAALAACAPVAGWLLTYAIHSTILLAAVGLLARRLGAGRPEVEETLWKGALVGALLTATLAVTVDGAPLRFSLGAPAAPPASLALAATPSLAGAAVPASGPGTAAPALSAATIAGGVALLWVLGSLAFLAALAVSAWRLRRFLADRRPLGDGPVAAVVGELGGAVGRPVRLSVSPRLAVPAAFGVLRPEVCLPERALHGLGERELRAVVAHELAHLARRDPLWRLVARLAAGVFFFQPLHRLAARRLERLSEYLADDWSAARTGARTALARSLAEVASWALERRRLMPLASIGGERGELRRRVARLLAGDRAAASRRPALLALVPLVLVLTWASPSWTAAAEDPPEEPSAEAAAARHEAEEAAAEAAELARHEAHEAEEHARRHAEVMAAHEEELAARAEELREHEERIRARTEEVARQIEEHRAQFEEQLAAKEAELREHEGHLHQRELELRERAEELAHQLEEKRRVLEQHFREQEEELRQRATELEQHARELAERAERQRLEEESADAAEEPASEEGGGGR